MATQELSFRLIIRGLALYLSVLALAAVILFVSGAGTSLAGVQGGSPPPPETTLIAHTLHAALAFALLLIFRAVYHLTRTSYVGYWGIAYLGFFLLYSYLSFKSYAKLSDLHPALLANPVVDGFSEELLSFLSTAPILAAAIAIRGIEVSKKALWANMLVLFCLVAALHLLTASLVHKASLLIQAELLPGGVLAFLALSFFALGLKRRLDAQVPSGALRSAPGPSLRRILFYTFLAYGTLQILIPYINAEHLGLKLTVITYVLKALCGGAVIFTVLNEAWIAKAVELEKSRAAENNLKYILRVTKHGYFRAAPDGTIVDLNDVEAAILGLSPDAGERGIANRFGLISDDSQVGPFREYLGAALQARDHFDNTIRRPDGTLVHLRTHGQVGAPGDGCTESGFMGIDRDITREIDRSRHREAEVRLQHAYSNALNTAEGLKDRALTRYFDLILAALVERTGAQEGVLLLSGEDSVRSLPLLVLQARSGSSRNRRPWVFLAPDLGAYRDQLGRLAMDPCRLAPGLFGCGSSEVCVVPMVSLTHRPIGLILLHVTDAQLSGEGVDFEALRILVSRVSTAYELVWRQELARLKAEVHSSLTTTVEIDQRLHALVSDLKRLLHVDSVQLSLYLRKSADLKQYDSAEQSTSLFPELTTLPDTPCATIADDLIRVEAPVSARVYSEALLPILNHKKEVIGLLKLRNLRRADGGPTAFADLDLEKASELTDTIGGIVETWRTFTDELLLFETAIHEMRSPAVAIRGDASNMLRYYEQYDDEKIQKVLSRVVKDATVIVGQVQNIDVVASRELSRASEVFLFEVVKKTFRQLASGTKANLDTRGKHLLPKMLLKEDEVFQIVFNLVSNALKYSRRDRVANLVVLAEAETNYFLLHFRDEGIGVPPGLEERIFDARFRAPNGARHEVRGMGLGLTVSRNLARGMGGDLRLTRHREPTELTWTIPVTMAKESTV